MATQVLSHQRRVLYPHAHWYFLAAIVTTWVGFSHSYFMRLGHVTVYHHIHGAIAGTWMALLVVQPILYQRGHLQLHRKLGYWGVYTLVPLMVLGGAVMIHIMMKTAKFYPPGVPYVLGFLDIVALVLFPAFVVLAIAYGKNMELHARWMACTVMLLLPVAIVRAAFFVPGIHTFTQALGLGYGVMDLIVLLLLVDDLRKGGIRLPYALMLGIQVILQLVMMPIGNSAPMHRLLDSWGNL